MLHPCALIQHTTSVQGLRVCVCARLYLSDSHPLQNGLAFPLAPACTRQELNVISLKHKALFPYCFSHLH